MAALIMTDADRAKFEPVLTEYYRDKGKTEEEIPKIIAKVFAQAQAGWNRCPRDLDTRIKMKSGFQWISHENLNPRKPKIEEEIVNTEVDEDMSENYLFSTMKKSEIEWWQDRMKKYTIDFEFNKSSDSPLLEQLLVEELMQRRLFKLSLRYPERDYNKKLTDSMKRVTEIQSKLGITREQRAGVMNKIDGNVAELALSLDKKMKDMPDIMKKQYEEEMKFVSLKAQKPPINILPPREKLEALLNVGGQISAQFDAHKMSQLTEEVGKQMAEDAEAKAEKSIPKPLEKKKLSDGIELP